MQAVTKPIENPSKDELGQVAEAVNGVRDRFEAGIDAYNQTRANLNRSGRAGVRLRRAGVGGLAGDGVDLRGVRQRDW